MGKQDFENINILPSEFDVVPAPQNSSNEGLVLPPNTNGNNVENAIDTATLRRFSPDGESPSQVDVDFVNRQTDPLSGEPVAIADATNELFMPSINKDIRVGSTSGQLTGHRDIFVAQGGVTPFAALERRKAAQQEAAAERKKNLDRFKVTLPKLSKDARFNDNILLKSSAHDEEFIARAKQQFGDGWEVALTSPQTAIGREYIQGKANIDLFAGKMDQVVDLMAEVDKAREEGDQFVSDITEQLSNEFKTLSGEFNQEGGNLGAADMGKKLDELNIAKSLDSYIKDFDVLDNIDGVIKQTAGINDNNFDHFRTTTKYTKDFTDGARAAAREIKNNIAFRSRPDLTENDVFKFILNLKGKTEKKTAKVSNKRALGSGEIDPDSIQISDQEKVINVGGKNFNVTKSVDVANQIKTKPIRFDGIIAVDSDGTLRNIDGIQNIKINSFGVMTDANGVERRVARAQQEFPQKDKVTGKPIKSIFKDIVLDFNNVEAGLSNSSANAKLFVDKFNNETSGVSRRSKKFIDTIGVSDVGDFVGDSEDVMTRFAESGFEFDEFNEFLSSESKAGRDVVLTEEIKKGFDTVSRRKAFERLKALNERRSRPVRLKEGVFTREELKIKGWTDEEIEENRIK